MPDNLEDPSPSKFRQQAVLVAVVLIILGIIVLIFASAIAGGVIAILGAIFGLGSQVVKENPFNR